MLEELKKKVYDANIDLVKKGLVFETWGNVSEIDRKTNLVVIKPSGVPYSEMKPEDMTVIELLTGKIVEGRYKPSSDTPTHLEIYKSFSEINGVAHTHSINATSFAQAGVGIKALGTTHADYFYGEIPCTRELTKEEVNNQYELNTGKVIVETLLKLKINPLEIPAVIVKNHGPFAWGTNAKEAVFIAGIMEKIAEMNIKTMMINKNSRINGYILDKHYQRKHGRNAYYGQKAH